MNYEKNTTDLDLIVILRFEINGEKFSVDTLPWSETIKVSDCGMSAFPKSAIAMGKFKRREEDL